jgi:hypothetical protein
MNSSNVIIIVVVCGEKKKRAFKKYVIIRNVYSVFRVELSLVETKSLETTEAGAIIIPLISARDQLTYYCKPKHSLRDV